MVYTIKNKFFSLGAGSTVKDSRGNDVLTVKGKVFTLTRKKYVCDMAGRELYVVKNKLINFLYPSAYICDPQGKEITHIKRKLFTLKTNFYFDLDGKKVSVSGNFIGWNLEVRIDGVKVGTVKRKIFHLTDTFELDTDERYLPILTAFVIALDNITDEHSEDNAYNG